MKIHNNFRVSALSITLLFLMEVVSLALGSSAKPRTSSAAEASKTQDVTLTKTESVESKPEVLFDDFSYTNQKELKKHGWIVRTVAGWPGVPGATWSEHGVSFLKDRNEPRNRILRMTSSTDGSNANTTQTQICHQRKYLSGRKSLNSQGQEGLWTW